MVHDKFAYGPVYSVNLNEKLFSVIPPETAEAMRAARKSYDLEPLPNGMFWSNNRLNRGDLFTALGINDNHLDFAVPQDWLDANREEYDRRGGAVWDYHGEHNLLGMPLFVDDAIGMLKQKIVKVLEENGVSQRRSKRTCRC